MGEFGFITADGIYHVTVYATDEEGKFRILAMRSYPYEDHPKTIEMVVRPKAKATTPKAIAPPSTTTTATTTERAKPKPFEKHNFSVQGCSGCFLKNDAPTTTTTTTQKPEDKKYDINLLSRPLPPEEAPRIGKQIISQVLPQVLQEVQQAETKMKETADRVPPRVAEAIGLDIDLRITADSTQHKQQAIQKTHTTPTKAQQVNAAKALTSLQKPQQAAHIVKAQSTLQQAQQGTQIVKAQSALQKAQQGTQIVKAQSTLQQAQQGTQIVKAPPTLKIAQQIPIKPQQQATQSSVKAQATQVTKQNTSFQPHVTQIQTQHLKPSPIETLSTNANQLSPLFLTLQNASGTPPSNTINNNSAKTPTTSTFGSGSAPKTPIKSGSNAPSKSGNNQPSAGKTGTTTGISTPKNQLAAPKLSPSAGIGGGSGSSASTGGAGRPNANAGFAGGVSGGNNNAGGSVGGGVNNRVGNSGNTASGNKIGGNTGAGASSAAGEAGDLYRFKYLLDYNGHRETGARNGNKEGSFYAIGDDNVERTIEYIANEFGYQPRVRFRKLDAPVQAKENTLKDYEFVWFKKE
ncbi:unnamed protein product [Ceratitis capitata]|uniref:(Mediterranean fruit fly) hypothetical protein n=1 Tax=Ceratitis capitata TaxID=7213 RepID=A0A811V1C2_CERCA|nr:unnamed protein product [Ceratitis capitata]